MAKIGDLVDRNVTSDIEILQSSPFPLLQIPYPLRDLSDLTAANRLSDSFSFSYAESLTNSGATSTVSIGTLERGVWDINVQTHYVSNYSQPGVVGFAVVLANAIVANPKVLINVMPFIGSEIITNQFRISIDRAQFVLRGQLTNNGVGQTHSHATTITGIRLL